MKIFRYLIFLSILSGIFVLIYRQSDEKGFRRWWISFKIAVLTAAIAAGLILLNTEPIESLGNNNQVYQERLLSEQEFNSFEDNDGQIILAKAYGNPVTPPTNRGPSNFPTPPAGGRPSRPVYVPKYLITPKLELGAAANPAGAGNGGRAAEFDDYCPAPNKEQSQKPETFGYRSNSPKKKKKSQDQCSIDEQNKAGIDELSDSSEFIYNLETKTARKALKKVWKNPEAKKEVLAGLDKMNNGELLTRNQKNFKGFKTSRKTF